VTHTTDVDVEVQVNGVTYRRAVTPSRILRDFIRDDVGLTGTKGACEDGMCGACSLSVDGAIVKSCLVLAAAADGKAVTTIEGLEQPDGSLHPVQQAMVDEFAFQCGFCTPGFAMTIAALLDSGASFDETSAREALVGNICRCTGYTMIVSALLAAQRARDEASTGPT
jgi:aerobic-type carbon monoxide dehydrogenase small subunit (CoxS/CutS family)